MKRSEVRDFIKSGVTAVNASLPFSSGRITEFNSLPNKNYPYTWLESLTVSTTLTQNGLPVDEWAITLHIVKKDQPGSSADEYEAIVDECDEYAQKFVKKYNAIVEDHQTVSLSNINRVPFIHKHSDDTSGVILSFTINAPDKTNLC